MKELLCEKAAERAGLKEIKLQELFEIANEAAFKGATVLKNNYGRIKEIKNKQRIGDLVTNADIEAEKEIINFLQDKTPEISILAEESGQQGETNSLTWCIDPLDGTTNYAHGYPFFASSIGLIWNYIPILGAISAPALNETFCAAPGKGAFCNSSRIEASKTESLINSLLVTGFAYDRTLLEDNNYAEYCWLTHRTRGVRRSGAASIDLAYCAAGRVDGYWERGLSPWDLAAGVAIAEISNCVITDYKNKEFDLHKGTILVCNQYIKNELLDELNMVKPLKRETYGAEEID